jgi:hypothetical protein
VWTRRAQRIITSDGRRPRVEFVARPIAAEADKEPCKSLFLPHMILLLNPLRMLTLVVAIFEMWIGLSAIVDVL